MHIFLFFLLPTLLFGKVDLGVDVLFEEKEPVVLRGKRIALLINHTSRNSSLKSTEDLFFSHAKNYHLVAIFVPEHGLTGAFHADEKVPDSQTCHDIPCYSLYGNTRRPTSSMLEGIDMIVCDLQDIGVRSYTYATTLFYVMEEAAKKGIEVLVLDRPNPMGGLLVDGPMLDPAYRSFIGYVDVPYCHGLTIGELAHFFNEEYHVLCKLSIIKMRGWKREMLFASTGLHWIPPSPNIPEPNTPLFYASVGILGTLNFLNIGGGINLPYKVVGAPWIDGELLAEKLNHQKLPGVYFIPCHYKPYYGAMKGSLCHGVQIVIQHPLLYRPMMTGYMILGILKSLYPKQFQEALTHLTKTEKESFCKANGNQFALNMLSKKKPIAWDLINYQKDKKEKYKEVRKKHLFY